MSQKWILLYYFNNVQKHIENILTAHEVYKEKPRKNFTTIGKKKACCKNEFHWIIWLMHAKLHVNKKIMVIMEVTWPQMELENNNARLENNLVLYLMHIMFGYTSCCWSGNLYVKSSSRPYLYYLVT